MPRLDADLDADLDAANLLAGSFCARGLTGDGVPPDWPDRVVATSWPGTASIRGP